MSEALNLGVSIRVLAFAAAHLIFAANGRFTRQPIPGNLIPVSRIDPVAKAIESYYAAPARGDLSLQALSPFSGG